MDNRPLSRWKIFNLPFFRSGANKNAPAETEPGTKPTKTPLVEALKIVNEESNRISGWCLLIIGGSILAILHKDYLKLEEDKWLYFIYILGWLSLCLSIYWGQIVTRGYLASLFVTPDLLDSVSEKVNIQFAKQLSWFMAGVIIFAAWMIIFLTLWIFNCVAITNP
ncbi:MAG: hypothetical protein JWQ63_2511 [Mucilaginibacter sp.]|nr:hypothetical protein [Mucilaginibacter sp.]